MLKVSEYQDRAVECRKMATCMRDLAKKAQFEEIARSLRCSGSRAVGYRRAAIRAADAHAHPPATLARDRNRLAS